MGKLIYLDHAAATPVDPSVLKAMRLYFCEEYANPSAVHQSGQKARAAIDLARQITAEILKCTPREIIFTSSGTEANNLFILGAAQANKHLGRHIITTKIEHESVLEPFKYLEKQGFKVTYLNVGKNGIVKTAEVAAALRPDTIFVSTMYANNEIGTIQPIAQIGRVIAEYKKRKKSHNKSRGEFHGEFGDKSTPLFHTDACQAACYFDLSVEKLGVDAMTLNGGKIYGPKGAGALFLKEGTLVLPQMRGGGQEYRVRSGTENVPAIVGFAEALKIVQKRRKADAICAQKLRDKLINGILRNIPRAKLNGDKRLRLPNNINVSFAGVDASALLVGLDMLGIEISAGSACSSGSMEISHVARALGLSEVLARGAVRFTLGRHTTEKEIDIVLESLPRIIKKLRKTSPF